MDTKRVGAGLAVGLLALAVLTGRQVSAAATAAPTVQTWMIGTVAPQGMVLADAVLKAMNDQGKPDASAMTAADWAQITQAAQALKASAGPIREAPALRVAADGVKIQDEGSEGSSSAAQVQGFVDKDRPGFNALARGLAQTSDAFIAAAGAKDAAKLLAASTALDAACQACHSKFWYPQQAPAPAQ
jgi:cytochrome c556